MKTIVILWLIFHPSSKIGLTTMERFDTMAECQAVKAVMHREFPTDSWGFALKDDQVKCLKVQVPDE